jgi:hypothetical protein
MILQPLYRPSTTSCRREIAFGFIQGKKPAMMQKNQMSSFLVSCISRRYFALETHKTSNNELTSLFDVLRIRWGFFRPQKFCTSNWPTVRSQLSAKENRCCLTSVRV